MTAVHALRMGAATAYLVREEGTILIDAGAPGREPAFRKHLQRLGRSPEEIGLLLHTHAHWDHIGSTRALRELTGAPAAVHHSEVERLEKGLKPIPPAVNLWGKFLSGLMGSLLTGRITLEPCPVDLEVSDDGLDLAEYGIRGRAVHTPGHSPGSLTVILENGQAFVGDMAMNRPLRLGPGPPVFAEDAGAIRPSWEKILSAGAETIYPAHGRPFPAEVMKKKLGL